MSYESSPLTLDFLFLAGGEEDLDLFLLALSKMGNTAAGRYFSVLMMDSNMIPRSLTLQCWIFVRGYSEPPGCINAVEVDINTVTVCLCPLNWKILSLVVLSMQENPKVSPS